MSEQSDKTTGDNSSTPPSRLQDLLAGFDECEMEFKNLKAENEKLKEENEELKVKKEKAERAVEELRKVLEDQYSKHWELENKCKDHTHALEVLESTLQKSIPLDDWVTPPQKLRTALEVAKEAIKAQMTKRAQEDGTDRAREKP
ncbi:hypothetical protein GGS24DRAFT_483826 [Hypoxylon argillaceum]|nr:hypothetical protein GGS24DRAFT_483826 [Hypoxylon argillaceum]